MKIVAVLLKGMKHYEYFEVDAWQTEKGVLTLIRLDAPGVIAAFPFENLLGIIDMSADAAVAEDAVQEKLRAAAKAALTDPS